MADKNSHSTGYTKSNTLVIVVVSVIVVAIAMAATILFLNKSVAIATVNGQKITKEDLYNAMYENAGSATLDNMVTELLIEQEAEKQDIAVTDNDVQKRLDKIIEQNFSSEAEFEQALMMYNMTRGDMEKNIKTELLMTGILRKDIQISEEEMKEYFDDNRSYFDSEEEVKVRHILVKDEKDANSILGELRNGADFAELANEKSIDGSKEDGGDLGFVKRQDVVKEFGDVAFTLAENEISDVVKTEYGYHILQVLEKRPAKEAVYEDCKVDIEDLILQSKVNELAGSRIMELKGNAKIEYLAKDNKAN